MANQSSHQGGSENPGTARVRGPSERGFAGMDPAAQREIASECGRAAHEKGTAHEFTSEEARKAGRKGGEATALNRRLAEMNRANAASGSGSSSGPSPGTGSGSRDH